MRAKKARCLYVKVSGWMLFSTRSQEMSRGPDTRYRKR